MTTLAPGAFGEAVDSCQWTRDRVKDALEEVAGELRSLTAASHEWQAQAQAKARKEARTLGRFNEARKAAKAVRKLGGKGNRWGGLKGMVKNPSMANLGEFATAQALHSGFSPVKGAVKGGLGLATVSGALGGPPEDTPYRVPNNRIEEAFG